MAPFDMLAIHVLNLGQVIDENPVAVHKGVQFDFIIDVTSTNKIDVSKVCINSCVSGSISANFGDFSQLKLNLAFVNHY